MSQINPRLYRNLVNECYLNISTEPLTSFSVNDLLPFPYNEPYIRLFNINLGGTAPKILKYTATFDTNTNTITIIGSPTFKSNYTIRDVYLEAYSYYTSYGEHQEVWYANMYQLEVINGENKIDINSETSHGIFDYGDYLSLGSGICPYTKYGRYDMLRIDTGYLHTSLCFKIHLAKTTDSWEGYTYVTFNIGKYINDWVRSHGDTQSTAEQSPATIKVSFNYEESSNVDITISNLSIVISDKLNEYIPTFEDCLYPLAILNDLLDIPNTSINNLKNDTSNNFLIYNASEDACEYKRTITLLDNNVVGAKNYAKLKTQKSCNYEDTQFVRYTDLDGSCYTVSPLVEHDIPAGQN